MSLIQVKNLTFGYEGSYDMVFENVSFQIDTDWRLGLVGRNGRGKTTLCRLLRGELEYRGTISAGVEFAYFPHQPGEGQLTRAVAEEVCPGFAEWELVRELSLLEVGEEVLDRPFDTLSSGERTKVLLAALFLGEHRFLLIDEPTNHLDLTGRRLVSRYLRGKEGFLLISHDRAFLDGCIDHVLALNRADVEVQRGNFSSWQENKARQDAFELAENERLRKDMKRLDEAARRASDWSDKTERGKYGSENSGLKVDRGYVGHKSAKMMKRAKSIQGRRTDAAEERAGLLKNIETVDDLRLTALTHHAKRLVVLEDVSIFYGGRAACSGVSLTVEPGQRLALRGRNGAGKSSILKLILGEELDYTGRMERAAGLVVSYVSQETAWLHGRPADFAAEVGLDVPLFLALLRKLGLEREQFEKDMADFSAGQKKKALLAAGLGRPAHLYVWDEPLNFLDVESRMQVETLLRTFAPTLLLVEHDAAFCEAVTTGEVVLA